MWRCIIYFRGIFCRGTLDRTKEESIQAFQLKFIIVIFLIAHEATLLLLYIFMSSHVYINMYICSTQFLLTFLLSYVRALPMGRLNLAFLHLSITSESLIPCTFEEDRALHTCVTSQGNFLSPRIVASQYSYLTATCYFVRRCLQEGCSNIPYYPRRSCNRKF